VSVVAQPEPRTAVGASLNAAAYRAKLCQLGLREITPPDDLSKLLVREPSEGERAPAPRFGMTAPQPGQLVRVRDRSWVVADVRRGALPTDPLSGHTNGAQHLVTLAAIDDDGAGEEARLVWELEPGARIVEQGALPRFDPHQLDDPRRLDAFLDAVRWGALTSADPRTLQAPFRAGIAIEDFQLDPVVRALRMPRTSLLIADDVGLGKTIEAGLVIQELALRHRARSVLVVCPASLQLKWQEEMREKFGLEFRIVDRALLADLRRRRGLHVNPWTHFPRLIVSIDWLKGDRPMELLREVLPTVPTLPRRFDLLVVDEAHNVAPAGGGRYATDTQRTRALRTLAPHCEHRLFLSATPHNGYASSFSALLELLDPQRFARGVAPDPEQLDAVMVRRLKPEITDDQGRPRFSRREVEALEVRYPDDERAAHTDLAAYARSRRRQAGQDGAASAVDFVLMLLKKRLFSSPAAFARTLAEHRRTLARRAAGVREARLPSEAVLRRAFEDAEQDVADEQEALEAEDQALEVAAAATGAGLSDEEEALLDRLEAWARRAAANEDAKCTRLLDWLEQTCAPGGEWNDERVIVFTEYRDTQRWLRERLAARDVPAQRVALLHGSLHPDEREQVKARFQADPSLDPARILVATDAASEGIDLQRHCHRLVHYEIPWNPNRLEQRNGRVDRHGQRHDPVTILHFVGAGYERPAAGSLEADLEFLAIAARKVVQIAADLGSVGPVIATQVEEAMLGRRAALETDAAERSAPSRRLLRAERDLRERVARLRERLDDSRAALRIDPDNVRHVVEVGLALAGQPALLGAEPDEHGRPRFHLPALTGSWAPATVGLAHPVTGAQRPVTFDHAAAAGRDDVVLVHLGHRLVTLATALLRAEVWRDDAGAGLRRATVRLAAQDADLDAPVALAHARLVLTGGAGTRLHEEVIVAGGALRDGRFTRLATVGEVEGALAAATADAPPSAALARLAAGWPDVEAPLVAALGQRARDRAQALQRTLERRADEDVAAVGAVLDELRRSIEATLAEPAHQQLELFSAAERDQLQRDTDALRRRVAQIPADLQRETAAVRARYAEPVPRLFPVAVSVVVPRALALR
jgi:superfamily II DNA or RNA helicase